MRNFETKTITVFEPDWQKFEEICEKEGFKRSSLIRVWVKRFISKNKQK